MNNELQETYKEVQYENEEEVFYECISDDEIVRYKTLTVQSADVVSGRVIVCTMDTP